MHDRREFIRVGGAAVAVGLAGCTGDGGDGGGGDGGGGDDDGMGGGDGSDGGAAVTVTVAPGGELAFDPTEVSVDTGATVEWVWEGNTHNVKPTSQPDGADWTGTEGDESTTYDEGHTYSHTFETAGTYEYVCTVHRSSMQGTIVVGSGGGGDDSGSTETEGGGGGDAY